MRERANKRHLLEHKPSRRTRRLSVDTQVSQADNKRVRRMLGK